MPDLAEPTEQPRQGLAWNAVGQQKIQIFICAQTG
jgi:hypothetical protein